MPFVDEVKPIRSSYEDLDGDGFEDINLKFDTQSIFNAFQNALSEGVFFSEWTDSDPVIFGINKRSNRRTVDVVRIQERVAIPSWSN